ncbi:MAG: ABC transporter ATP-binding protein [Rhodospirillales bacterium]|nr:ABC transporter ATP-binding protein [Rhodospirillales bacterium]
MHPSPATSLAVAYRIAQPIALDARFTIAGFTVLLGASGTGKTTLLRALAGLLPAQGTPWGGLPAEARPIGYLPQGTALFPHLTALENAAYALRGTDRLERGRHLLAELGIADLASRRGRDLSGGEAQRVGLARALARDPALLLLDEPSSALDASTKEAVFAALIEAVAARAIPTLAATHDPAIALLAERLVLMGAGGILQEGTPRDLARHPANEEAARLLGYQNIWRAADGRLVAIRAEDVRLDDGAAPEGAAEMLEGIVATVHDAGHAVRVKLAAPLPLIAMLRSAPVLTPGQRIRLRLPHRRIVAVGG